MSVDRCICANISSPFDPPISPTSRSCVCAHLIDDLAIPDLWLVVYATFVSLYAPHLYAPSHYFPVTPRYHLDKRHLYMPKTTKIYQCNWEKRCKGQEKVLGRKAYYAYKKYCNYNPVSQFSQQHQDFLAQYPVIENLSSSDASQHTACPLTLITESISGPSSQHTCQLQLVDPNDDRHATVSASVYAHMRQCLPI